MKRKETEQQRIQRIRDEQVAARYGGMSGRLQYYDRMKKVTVTKKPQTLMKRIFGVFDARMNGVILGFVAGMVFFVVMQALYGGDSFLGQIAMIFPFVGIIFGYAIGSAFRL